MPLPRVAFALRCDDHVLGWQMVRAGLGIGFLSHYVAATDPSVRRELPELSVPPLPMWLAVHRQIRGSTAIRAVYELLADGLAKATITTASLAQPVSAYIAQRGR